MPASTKVDRFLRNRGLGGLNDPNLTHQMAFLVRDHEHFRKILTACEPNKRKLAYEQMRPHLTFQPKPLEVYMSESAEIAEHKQLPTYYAEDDIRPHKVPEFGVKQQIERALGMAVIEQVAETQKRKRLTVNCSKCPSEITVFALDKASAYQTAEMLRWKFEGDKALCPNCAQSPRT